jgi:hypothetical protein
MKWPLQLAFLIIAALCSMTAYGQTEKRSQFWSEAAFMKDLSEKWALEFNGGLQSSGVPGDDNIFHGITQVYFRAWGHYYPGERWKLSAFYAYYYNSNVPELEQDKASEYRSALQVTYNILKHRFTLNARFRIEDRHIQNDESYFEAVERFRFQLKTTFPVNKHEIEPNALYLFSSDEIAFKTKSQISGPENFDRNRFTLGMGYVFASDIQLELSFVNEYLPRTGHDQIYNAFQANVIFTDFLPNLLKSFKRKKKAVDDGSNIN